MAVDSMQSQILSKDLASQILVFTRRARSIVLIYGRFCRQSEAHRERIRADQCIYSVQPLRKKLFKIRNLPTEHVVKILSNRKKREKCWNFRKAQRITLMMPMPRRIETETIISR